MPTTTPHPARVDSYACSCVSTDAVIAAAGGVLTTRQIHYWTEQGWTRPIRHGLAGAHLPPEQPAGSGTLFGWPPVEVRLIVVAAHLVQATGMLPRRALQLAAGPLVLDVTGTLMSLALSPLLQPVTSPACVPTVNA
jgi:hypothetical protein